MSKKTKEDGPPIVGRLAEMAEQLKSLGRDRPEPLKKGANRSDLRRQKAVYEQLLEAEDAPEQPDDNPLESSEPDGSETRGSLGEVLQALADESCRSSNGGDEGNPDDAPSSSDPTAPQDEPVPQAASVKKSPAPEDRSTPNDATVYTHRYRALLINDSVTKTLCEREGVNFSLVPLTQANAEIKYLTDPGSLNEMLKELERHAVDMLGLPTLDELYEFVREFRSAAEKPEDLKAFLSHFSEADKAFMREQASKRFYATSRAFFGRFTRQQILEGREAERKRKMASQGDKKPQPPTPPAPPETDPADQEGADTQAEMRRKVEQAEQQIPPDIQEGVAALIQAAPTLVLPKDRTSFNAVAAALIESFSSVTERMAEIASLETSVQSSERIAANYAKNAETVCKERDEAREDRDTAKEAAARRVVSPKWILSTVLMAVIVVIMAGIWGISSLSSSISSSAPQTKGADQSVAEDEANTASQSSDVQQNVLDQPVQDNQAEISVDPSVQTLNSLSERLREMNQQLRDAQE